GRVLVSLLTVTAGVVPSNSTSALPATSGMTTSSLATGTPVSQLAALLHRSLAPAPVQVRVAGVTRSSNNSTSGRNGRRVPSAALRDCRLRRARELSNGMGRLLANGKDLRPEGYAR